MIFLQRYYLVQTISEYDHHHDSLQIHFFFFKQFQTIITFVHKDVSSSNVRISTQVLQRFFLQIIPKHLNNMILLKKFRDIIIFLINMLLINKTKQSITGQKRHYPPANHL